MGWSSCSISLRRVASVWSSSDVGVGKVVRPGVVYGGFAMLLKVHVIYDSFEKSHVAVVGV